MASLTKRTRRGAQDRKEELLAVAREMSHSVGVFGLKADSIAAQAQISRPLIFHYFGSLPELQHLVIRSAVEDLIHALDPEQLQTTSDLDFKSPAPFGQPLAGARTEALIAVFVATVTAHKQLWLDLWAGAGQDNPKTVALLADSRAHLANRLIHNMVDLSNISNEVVDLVSFGWVSMAESMTARWLATGTMGPVQLVSLIRRSLDVTIRSIIDGQPQS